MTAPTVTTGTIAVDGYVLDRAMRDADAETKGMVGLGRLEVFGWHPAVETMLKLLGRRDELPEGAVIDEVFRDELGQIFIRWHKSERTGT